MTAVTPTPQAPQAPFTDRQLYVALLVDFVINRGHTIGDGKTAKFLHTPWPEIVFVEQGDAQDMYRLYSTAISIEDAEAHLAAHERDAKERLNTLEIFSGAIESDMKFLELKRAEYAELEKQHPDFAAGYRAYEHARRLRKIEYDIKMEAQEVEESSNALWSAQVRLQKSKDKKRKLEEEREQLKQ